jgi:hypothetical protein
MRTTLNVPDALVLQAKQRALAEHTTVTALMVEGLATRLRTKAPLGDLPCSTEAGGLCAGLSWEHLQADTVDGAWYR